MIGMMGCYFSIFSCCRICRCPRLDRSIVARNATAGYAKDKNKIMSSAVEWTGEMGHGSVVSKKLTSSAALG